MAPCGILWPRAERPDGARPSVGSDSVEATSAAGARTGRAARRGHVRRPETSGAGSGESRADAPGADVRTGKRDRET
ncbi:hypothetical protein GCM10027161_38930 [Microbispora hainanensis]